MLLNALPVKAAYTKHMVKTNTQHQLDYQRRQLEAGSRRLDLFISADAQAALARIAERENCTRKNAIENLLINGVNEMDRPKQMTAAEAMDLHEFKQQLPALNIMSEQDNRAHAFDGGDDGARSKAAFNAAINASNIHRK
ncbi:MAG: hypothetical protein ACT4OH_06180 [Methylophilaceae bacterium]